jgi:mannose-6-phosphate isomerase-like protein (cupin superfamily)
MSRSPRRPTHPAHPLARALLLLALLGAAAAEGQLVDSEEVLARRPADPTTGATVTEVLRGTQASVNVWQISGQMPPHLHRGHEEVIVVRSGRARARIGDRTVELGPGDVLLVPKDTVHAARTVGEEPLVGVSVFAPPFDGSDRVPVPEATP